MSKSEKETFRAWVGLIRSRQLVMDDVEAELKAARLPPLAWYDVLLELNREAEKCLRLQEIGERILLAKNNVTRLVDRLEQEKLVTREKCHHDGRGIYARMTKKGQDLLHTMWPVYRKAVQTHFSQKLDDHDIEALLKIAERLHAPPLLSVQKKHSPGNKA